LELFKSPQTFETGADRQRHVFREQGTWQAVVDDMTDCWARSLQQSLGEVPNSVQPKTKSSK
jgi:hypothetical protein